MKILVASFLSLFLSLGCYEALAESEDEPIWQSKALAEWVAALKDPDAQVRHRAAYALWQMGPKAKRAFPALKEASKDSDPSVRQYSSWAMGNCGPDALPLLLDYLDSEDSRANALYPLQQLGREVVPELLKRLQGADVSRRRAIAGILGPFAQKSKDVAPALRQAIRDPDILVRLNAAFSLRSIDYRSSESLAVFTLALKDKDPTIRMRALEGVEGFGTQSEDAVPLLRKMMKEETGRVRIRAIRALWDIDFDERESLLSLLIEAIKGKDENECQEAMFHLGNSVHRDPEELRPALPAILALIKDRKHHKIETVRSAIWTLRSLEQDPKEVLPVCLELAKDNDPAILEESVGWLPWLAPKDPAVPTLLIRALKHKELKVRIAAGHALSRKGVQIKEAIPLLIDALKEASSPQLRWLAASSLGEYGADAKAAIPALMRALDDKDVNLRINAAQALSRIDPREAKAAVPILIRVLDSSESWHLHSVVETLRKFGSDGVTELSRGLRHTDKQYRLGAAIALAAFGPEAKAAVPDLKAALRDKEATVRLTAALALSRLEIRGDEVKAALIEGIVSRDLSLRQPAIWAVASLGANGKAAVPMLVRILRDKDEAGLRRAAASALGMIGSGAAPAVPALVEAVKDEHSELRDTAIEALGKIGGTDKSLVPILVESMLTYRGSSNHHAMQVLRKAGAEAIPHLIKGLKDKDPEVRATAAGILIYTGPAQNDDIREALEAALKDEVPRVRLAAATPFLFVDRESRASVRQVLEVVKAALKDSDPAIRTQAIGILQQIINHGIGGRPPEVMTLLIDQLKEKDPMVRRAALQAIASAHPPTKEAFEAVLDALKGKDPNLIVQAVETLQRFRPDAKEAIPTLLLVLKTKKNQYLQDSVIRTLSNIGRDDQAVADALIEVFKNSSNKQVRGSVLYALTGFGAKAEKALPAIVEAFNDEQLRQAAMAALTQIDPKNKLLPPAFADMLGKQEYHEIHRHRVRDDDEKHKPFGPEKVKEFGDLLLKDASPERRAGAARALATVVRSGPGLSAPLREALKDENVRVRLYAAEALWTITGDAAAALPVITPGLKHKDRAIRVQSASILSSMGPEAKGAVADLAEALKDDDISYVALRALRGIGPDAALAVPALIELLQSDVRPHIHLEAVWTLSQCGRQAQEAVPQLLKMMKTAERDHRPVIAAALAKIGSMEQALPAILDLIRESKAEDENSALPHSMREALAAYGPEVCGPLAKLLKEKEPFVRRLTVEVLASFGQQAIGVLPNLLDSLADKEDAVAVRAAEAVWRIDKRKEALAVFIRCVKSKTPDLRIRAVQGLRVMGDDGKAAVPELLAAYRDRDRLVRREAYHALQQLDPKTAATLANPDQE